jgi:ADP-ribose pyrophosphatase
VGEYRLLESKELSRGGFLTLFEERFAAPDGEEFTRWVVRHPGAVAAVPVVNGSDPDRPEVLLVRQYRPAIRRTLLELPAGKLDVPGEDPADAMVRELAEEIQHRPGRLVKLTSFWNSPGFSTEFTHLYLALDLEPCASPEPAKEEEKDMTIERVTLADAGRLATEGEITDAKSIIGLLLAERYLASAQSESR